MPKGTIVCRLLCLEPHPRQLQFQTQASKKPDLGCKLRFPRHLRASSAPDNKTCEPVNNFSSCSWKQLALRSYLEPQTLPHPEGKGKWKGKEKGG